MKPRLQKLILAALWREGATMPFAGTVWIIQLDAVNQPMSRFACAPCDRLALSTFDGPFSAEVKVSGTRFR